MGGAGRGDVEQVPALVVGREGGSIALDDDDVVEFQAFDLTNVRHVDARTEGEVLLGDPPKVRHLPVAKALVIDVRLLGIAGNDRDRGQRLRAHEVPKCLGKEAHCLTAAPKLEEFDRGAVADGIPRDFVAQRPEDVSCEVEDLVGRAVAQLEGLDLDVVELQLFEHVAPIRETVVEMELLRNVAGECHALLLRRSVQHDRQLDGAHVLRFIDNDRTVR